MKILKKIITSVLCVSLFFSLLGVRSYATDNTILTATTLYNYEISDEGAAALGVGSDNRKLFLKVASVNEYIVVGLNDGVKNYLNAIGVYLNTTAVELFTNNLVSLLLNNSLHVISNVSGDVVGITFDNLDGCVAAATCDRVELSNDGKNYIYNYYLDTYTSYETVDYFYFSPCPWSNANDWHATLTGFGGNTGDVFSSNRKQFSDVYINTCHTLYDKPWDFNTFYNSYDTYDYVGVFDDYAHIIIDGDLIGIPYSGYLLNYVDYLDNNDNYTLSKCMIYCTQWKAISNPSSDNPGVATSSGGPGLFKDMSVGYTIQKFYWMVCDYTIPCFKNTTVYNSFVHGTVDVPDVIYTNNYYNYDVSVDNSDNISYTHFTTVNTNYDNVYTSVSNDYSSVVNTDLTQYYDNSDYSVTTNSEGDTVVENLITGDTTTYKTVTNNYGINENQLDVLIQTVLDTNEMIDNSGEGSSGSSDSSSGGSSTDDPVDPEDTDALWDRLLEGIANLLSKIGELLGAILTGIVEMITNVIDAFTGLVEDLGSFPDFLTALFPFIPDEVSRVLWLSIMVCVVGGVIKFLRG